MDILDRLLGHDAWTTRELLQLCQNRVDESAFQKSFAIGPGSLHDTFVHIIGTMEYWADRISDRPDESRTCDRMVGERHSPAALRPMLDAAAEGLRRVAEDVRDSGRLDEIMQVTFEARDCRFTRGSALVHVCTHGMHHRAQIINMLQW